MTSLVKGLRQRAARPLQIATKGKDDAGKAATEIQSVTQEQYDQLYKMEGQVMESTNPGMEVRFATRKSDGLKVVVKTRDRKKSFKDNYEEREWRCTTEIQLRMPKSDSLCGYLGVYSTDKMYYIVMEKVEGQDLFEQMSVAKVPMVDSRALVKQILEGLLALHQSGRIHKDIKLENVVADMDSPRRKGEQFDSPVMAQIIDFDTVQDWEPKSPRSKTILGTDGYIAPEAYDGNYSPASDVYCAGVIMYKLLTRRFPHKADLFDDKPGENKAGHPAMKRIQQRLLSTKIDFDRPPLDKCPLAKDLVSRMLEMESEKRPTSEETLDHPWFKVDAKDLETA
jgi:serine/threonine protein kinase